MYLINQKRIGAYCFETIINKKDNFRVFKSLKDSH